MGVRTIAATMMSGVVLKFYRIISYHNEELKSLSRYRFDKARQRALLKQSFQACHYPVPGTGKARSGAPHSVGLCSVYRTDRRKRIALCHLTRLTNLLSTVELRNAARRSIGSAMPVKSLKLQHTIRLIRELNAKIRHIEAAIKQITIPILAISGISYRMGAKILTEIDNFSRFGSPDKTLTYACLPPSTYRPGNWTRKGFILYTKAYGFKKV